MKYSIFDSFRQVMAPVPECAVKSYLTSYAGNLEELTIFGEDDPDRIDGLPATEWLKDNPEALAVPTPPHPPETLSPNARHGFNVGWVDGYVAGAGGIKGHELVAVPPGSINEFRAWLKKEGESHAKGGLPQLEILLESVSRKFDELF